MILRLIRVNLLVVVVCFVFVNSVITLKCDSDSQQEGCKNSTSTENDTSTTTESKDGTSTSTTSTSPTITSTLSSKVETTTVFRPTILPEIETTTISVNVSKEAKGRALNFTLDNTSNILSSNVSHRTTHDQLVDLSDVSINEEEEEEVDKILGAKGIKSNNFTLGICEKGGLTYENGERLEIDCDTVCTCSNGNMDCTDRCMTPFTRRGKKNDDPLCIQKPAEDPCCSVLICSADTETEPLEICSHNNKTYNRGDTFNKGCEEVCICEAGGRQSCKPRCSPPTNKTSDRCVEVPHPSDRCCKKVLCDVTLDDHESEKEDDFHKVRLTSAEYVNSTTIMLSFDSKIDLKNDLHLIDVSDDRSTWKTYQIQKDGYVQLKDPGKYVRFENSDEIVPIKNNESENSAETDNKTEMDGKGCRYKGRSFKFEEEFNDDCTSLCVCKENGVKCLKIECPTYFGIDVLDPQCVEWETVPPDFKPKAPNCCPEKLRCKSNGSCEFEGKMYSNWEQVPENITGCDKKCYCEMGKVECQSQCPPMTAIPPPTLRCPSNEVAVGHIPEDECCMYWVCKSDSDPYKQKLNKTIEDKLVHQSENKTDEFRLDQFTEKTPSKVLGPLLVYTNQDDVPFDSSTKTTPILPDENPFFHKAQGPKSKATQGKSSNDYNRPVSPGHKKPSPEVLVTFKPQKSSNRNKSNKNNMLFITPPPKEHNKPIPIPIQGNLPQTIPPPPPLPRPHEPHIHIHGKGSPHELIHFINQHPEITNYPSGSVLEIQHVPRQPKPPHPQFIGTNLPHIPHHDKPVLVPYVVPQQSEELPGGLSLEQFLQELHKNVHEDHPLIPIGGPNHFNNNNGLVIAQSGPVLPPRPNASFPGHGGHIFPGNFNNVHQEEIIVHTLEAIDSHRVKLVFMVPPIIVGLHGRVEVRYTSKQNDDISTWEQQVFAPPNDLIATPQLEFDLLGLRPDTEYKIKITVTLRDAHNTPSSRVYKIITPKEVSTTTLPPMIPIEPELAITDINATWVTVVWRKFTDYELQFIDGVQLRYKEIDGKVYSATPLIHRAVTTYTLEKLKPNTKYEIGIFFIPFPGQQTELHAEHMLHFTTANYIDTYGFNVTLEVSQIKSTSIEIVWSGVPYPEDKYVSIYRAIYQSDTGKEDQSTFKMAKRDSPTKTIIMDLKPGTRYRLWLEVYLTNGKVKMSNVQEFMTRPRTPPALGASTQQDKLSRQHLETRGDYYGPLVIVAILASIAILSTLVLLLILVRRHNQNKAPITPPSRVSQSAYDNPTYKVEIQQETMGL